MKINIFRSMLRRNQTKHTLVNAPDECCFWTCDGRVLRNLHDLHHALQEMSEETFCYHVNKEKNDLAKWVRQVLQDSQLAKDISRIRTRKVCLEKVGAGLKRYR